MKHLELNAVNLFISEAINFHVLLMVHNFVTVNFDVCLTGIN